MHGRSLQKRWIDALNRPLATVGYAQIAIKNAANMPKKMLKTKTPTLSPHIPAGF